MSYPNPTVCYMLVKARGHCNNKHFFLPEFNPMTSLRLLFLPILAFLYAQQCHYWQNETVIEDAVTVTTTPAHRMDENNKRRGPWWKDQT